MPTTFKLEAPWETVKARIREVKYDLTDEDLQYSPGQEDQLLDRLEKKTKMKREDIIGWIESLSHTSTRAS